MSYNVYLVDYIGMPRNHHGIFVETHESGDKTGYLYQVSGSIQTGMVHEHKRARQPETSSSFGGLKNLLGIVTLDNYQYMRSTCDNIPPPEKQFNGPKRIYPNIPLRRCQEWTNEAIEALISQGVIEPPQTSTTASYWTWSDQYQRHYHEHSDGRTEWAPEE